MSGSWRVIGLLLLVAGAFAAAWQFQGWRYGRQLADQARLNAETQNQLTLTAATAQQAEQDKRLALEQRLHRRFINVVDCQAVARVEQLVRHRLAHCANAEISGFHA